MHRVHPEIRKRARQFRQPQTPAERKLWTYLRNEQLEGYKFRRQHPIGYFIADFYCAQAKLVIEIDGDSHAGQVEYDRERTECLQSQEYCVIRFSNQEVEKNLFAVLDKILEYCKVSTPIPSDAE